MIAGQGTTQKNTGGLAIASPEPKSQKDWARNRPQSLESGQESEKVLVVPGRIIRDGTAKLATSSPEGRLISKTAGGKR